MRHFLLTLIPLFLLGLGACSIDPNGNSLPPGPTPRPINTPTPPTAAQVEFHLTPPPGTPDDAHIDLVIVDEVTGIDLYSYSLPLTKSEEDTWSVSIQAPVGSLLRYKYVLREPDERTESSISGEAVRYRVAHVPGFVSIQDIVPIWTGEGYDGVSGRIIGQLLDQTSGNPLSELMVFVGGMSTFSDSEGRFRIDGLPPGLHTLTVVSHDGSFRTLSQEVRIAADRTTPVEMELSPAVAITVTFEVTVPSDTIPGTPLRMAGNVSTLGNRFSSLRGNFDLSIAQMPHLIMVDAENYLFVYQLYGGTDLRYKYTQGDGLWNAERDQDGNLVTRQIILPDEDITIEDTIATWHVGEQSSLAFHVFAPEHTSPLDDVSLQFHSGVWYEPIPMWKIGSNEWFYILNSPLNFIGEVEYRYCRNLQCGSADDIDTFGPEASGRPLVITGEQEELSDTVRDWQWYEEDVLSTTVTTDEITPRSDYVTGIQINKHFHPSITSYVSRASEDIQNLGANSIVFSPTWMMETQNPIPLFGFDPARAPFEHELKAWIDTSSLGKTQIAIRPALTAPSGNLNEWWISTERDRTWWTIWFEEYRSFILTYADIAERTGAHQLVLGGAEATPAYPGGYLPNGNPSGVPSWSEERWSDLIAEVRDRYSGRIGLELDAQTALEISLDFLEDVDDVFLFWSEPLASDENASVAEMYTEAESRLDELLLASDLSDFPIIIVVEYPSVVGGTQACPPAPDGSCRASESFSAGATVDPDLDVDLEGQFNAINALLLAAYSQEEITGFHTRGYDPAVALRDKSTSIHGKPAQDLIWYWYPRMLGRVDEP